MSAVLQAQVRLCTCPARYPPLFPLCSRPLWHRYFSVTPYPQVKKRMPPKKAAEKEKKTLLGRPSNNLKIGIVGRSIASYLAFLSSMDADLFRYQIGCLIRPAQRRKIVFFQRSVRHRYAQVSFFIGLPVDLAGRSWQGSEFSIRYNQSRGLKFFHSTFFFLSASLTLGARCQHLYLFLLLLPSFFHLSFMLTHTFYFALTGSTYPCA